MNLEDPQRGEFRGGDRGCGSTTQCIFLHISSLMTPTPPFIIRSDVTDGCQTPESQQEQCSKVDDFYLAPETLAPDTPQEQGDKVDDYHLAPDTPQEQGDKVDEGDKVDDYHLTQDTLQEQGDKVDDYHFVPDTPQEQGDKVDDCHLPPQEQGDKVDLPPETPQEQGDEVDDNSTDGYLTPEAGQEQVNNSYLQEQRDDADTVPDIKIEI